MTLPKTIPIAKPTQAQIDYCTRIASCRLTDPDELAKIRIGGPKPEGFYEGR